MGPTFDDADIAVRVLSSWLTPIKPKLLLLRNFLFAYVKLSRKNSGSASQSGATG
jgi:hypothetical protein